jgi:hypothetical protein
MRSNLIISLVVLAVASGAAADQGRTEIGPTDVFPIAIDQPGSYVLTADLQVTSAALNGIEIESDGVTLDLGGHVIRGPGESTSTGIGIYSVERDDLAIRNGTIVEFGWGLFLAGADPGQASHRVEDLTVGRCGTEGVSLSGGVARNIVVHDNGRVATTGYGLNCAKCTLRDVDARRNQKGIRVNSGSIENCLAIENVENGFNLENASLRGGTASANGGDGVYTNMKSLIIGVVVGDNGGWGIRMTADSNSSAVNCAGGDNTLGNITGCGDGNGCYQNYLP